jgi:hypothetical protein
VGEGSGDMCARMWVDRWSKSDGCALLSMGRRGTDKDLGITCRPRN